MLSTQSLRDQLQRYADGRQDIAALEEWLASESWDMKRWASIGLQRMIASIHVALVDHNDGRLAASEVDALLRSKLGQLRRAETIESGGDERSVREWLKSQAKSSAPFTVSRSVLAEV